MSTKRQKHPMLVAAFVALLAALPAFAADGDKSNIKGMITAVQGNNITVRDSNNVEKTVTVSPETIYYKTKGLTGALRDRAEQSALIPGLAISADVVAQGNNITVRDSNNVEKTVTVSPETIYYKTKGLTGALRDRAEQSALIPGLAISADVVAQGDGFNATQINFKSEDLKTAQQVQAGLAPTTARMDQFGTYEALETVEVLFDTGSTKISDKGQSDLMAFAGKAKDTQNYQVVLQGFTDSTGNAAANQRLSRMRAESVANFLQQQGGLMPGRVRGADGMGVASDAGSGSNASARKVVVKLVVDKGVQAGNK